MRRAIIFGASKIKDLEYINKYIDKDDLIICADGGYAHVKKLGIKPDIIIGDFDSYDKNSIGDESIIISAKEEKDETDTELALTYALQRGIKEVLMFGCLYGRLDHTFANIWLLIKYKRLGMNIIMIGYDDVVMTAVNPLVIQKTENSYISLYSISEIVRGLTLKGLKYPLSGYDLKRGDVIGTSNEFIDDSAQISFDEGELLIIISNKRRNGKWHFVQAVERK